MPIRSIDLQTMIPKLPEVQKARSVEAETPQNNSNINLHKEQVQNEKNLKQVYKKDKTSGTRINRDQGKGKQQQEQKEKDDEEDRQKEKEKGGMPRPKTKIDIRI